MSSSGEVVGRRRSPEPDPGDVEAGQQSAGDDVVGRRRSPEPDPDPDPLLERLRRIGSMPVGDRVAAIESLNRSVVVALGELEQL